MTPLPKHIKTQEVRRATCRVTAVVPLCGVDAVLWLDQLMAEFERLDWNVAWHFNNISDELSLKAANFPRTVAYSWAAPGTVYTDYDRTWATELAEQAGSPWICCQDADETLELRAPEMLNRILTDRSIHIARWYNIWQVDPDGSLWIRTDTPFISHKVKHRC